VRIPRAHPTWISTQLERLDGLLRTDPARAKAELIRHLEGDLVIKPLPGEPGERRAEISGRVKPDRPPGCPGGRLPSGGCGGWI
jgi:hypothetical protein